MIIRHRDLINISDTKRYDINIESILFEDDILVREIKNINGYIDFFYDLNDTLFISYDIDCDIRVPGSLSPEDVTYHDSFQDEEEVALNEMDEGFYIRDNSSDSDLVKSIVIPNIPLKVPNNGDSLYAEGDGWTITSEKEYAKISKEKEDPRLSVLKKYKED